MQVNDLKKNHMHKHTSSCRKMKPEKLSLGIVSDESLRPQNQSPEQRDCKTTADETQVEVQDIADEHNCFVPIYHL